MIEMNDIFKKYDEVKLEVQRLINDENNEELNKLAISFAKFLTTFKPEYHDKELANVAEFLTTIPTNSACEFVNEVDKLEKCSDGFRYIGVIHSKLMNLKLYRTGFYDKLMDHEKIKRNNNKEI